jgi:hypothetical protein
MLKNRTFNHTRGFDDDLLEKTGMDEDFANVWKAVGWSTFANVTEMGSQGLMIQFLCTLVEEANGVSFWFFGNEYSFTWKELSMLLGFHHRCTIDVERALRGFHKESFWQSITGQTSYGGARCNDIQNLTLRLMHKWVAITCFPREDVRIVRVDELRIIYAMVNRIKLSPVKFMVCQWLENFRMIEPVECTSLITRIAQSLGVLNWARISYISAPRLMIDENYLVYGHTLKHAKDASLIFFFPGYVNEIPLPNLGFHLYK